MVPIDFSFNGELNSVLAHLREEIKLKPVNLDDLVEMKMNDLDKSLNPAIVLAVSGSFGYHDRKSEALAGIIQFIFMANRVHRLMRDEADLAEERRQFPVLVGDLLYGKFFLELCREKMLFFLAPLAEAMGTLSQGGISRWLSRDKRLNKEEMLRIIEMESASLTGAAARLSAELAGASLPLQKKMESFGWELGLAWGAWRERMDHNVVMSILRKAYDILEDIKEESQIETHPLHEIFNYLSGQLNVECNF